MTAAATSSHPLHSKLDDLHVLTTKLNPSSSQEDLEEYGSFFTPDCKAYLLGMAAPPSIGREGVVAALKQVITYWSLPQRRVLSRAVSQDGTTIVAEMDNVITIAGETLDHFAEIEVAQYEGNLIKEYRLYVDPTPITKVLEAKQAEATDGKSG